MDSIYLRLSGEVYHQLYGELKNQLVAQEHDLIGIHAWDQLHTALGRPWDFVRRTQVFQIDDQLQDQLEEAFQQ